MNISLYEEVDTMIKIDIDMPVSCNYCPCLQVYGYEYYCGVRKELDVTDNKWEGTRHCMCPLIKVD